MGKYVYTNFVVPDKLTSINVYLLLFFNVFFFGSGGAEVRSRVLGAGSWRGAELLQVEQLNNNATLLIEYKYVFQVLR